MDINKYKELPLFLALSLGKFLKKKRSIERFVEIT